MNPIVHHVIYQKVTLNVNIVKNEQVYLTIEKNSLNMVYFILMDVNITIIDVNNVINYTNTYEYVDWIYSIILINMEIINNWHIKNLLVFQNVDFYHNN